MSDWRTKPYIALIGTTLEKGFVEWYSGDWRFQFHFPNFSYHRDHSSYQGKTRNWEFKFAFDAPAFRLNRIIEYKTDGSVYSYFAFGLVFVFGIAIEYLKGRGEARIKEAERVKEYEQKEARQLEYERRYAEFTDFTEWNRK